MLSIVHTSYIDRISKSVDHLVPIVLPFAFGVAAFYLPKFLSREFPRDVDGRAADVFRTHIRRSFDGYLQKNEDAKWFFRVATKDNGWLAAYLVAYWFCRPSISKVIVRKGITFGDVFVFSILWFQVVGFFAVLRCLSYGLVAPVVEKHLPRGERIGYLFRKLGPSDWQLPNISEAENDQVLED